MSYLYSQPPKRRQGTVTLLNTSTHTRRTQSRGIGADAPHANGRVGRARHQPALRLQPQQGVHAARMPAHRGHGVPGFRVTHNDLVVAQAACDPSHRIVALHRPGEPRK